MFNYDDFDINGFYEYILRKIANLKFNPYVDDPTHPAISKKIFKEFRNQLITWTDPKDKTKIKDKIDEILNPKEYDHNLMYLREQPDPDGRRKGFYLYRNARDERIYVLVVHSQSSHEILDLSEITQDADNTGLLSNINWPEDSDKTTTLAVELVKKITSNCKHTYSKASQAPEVLEDPKVLEDPEVLEDPKAKAIRKLCHIRDYCDAHPDVLKDLRFDLEHLINKEVTILQQLDQPMFDQVVPLRAKNQEAPEVLEVLEDLEDSEDSDVLEVLKVLEDQEDSEALEVLEVLEDPEAKVRNKLLIILDFCYAHFSGLKSTRIALKPIINEMTTVLTFLDQPKQDHLAQLLAKWDGLRLLLKYGNLDSTQYWSAVNVIYSLADSARFVLGDQIPPKLSRLPDTGVHILNKKIARNAIKLYTHEQIIEEVKNTHSDVVKELKDLEGQNRTGCFGFFKCNNKDLKSTQKELKKIEDYVLTHKLALDSFQETVQNDQPQQDRFLSLYNKFSSIINELINPSLLTRYESRRELISTFNTEAININNNDDISDLDKIVALTDEMVKLTYKMAHDDKDKHPRDLIKANKPAEIIKKAFKLLSDSPESQLPEFRQKMAAVRVRNEYFRWRSEYAKKLKRFGPFHSEERKQQAKDLLGFLKPSNEEVPKQKGTYIENNIDESIDDLLSDNVEIYKKLKYGLFQMDLKDQSDKAEGKGWFSRSTRGFNNLRSIMEDMVNDYEKHMSTNHEMIVNRP